MESSDPVIDKWVWTQTQYCTWYCNIGRLRRKEKIVYPIKNGFPIEKKAVSQQKNLHVGSFGSAYSFLELKVLGNVSLSYRCGGMSVARLR